MLIAKANRACSSLTHMRSIDNRRTSDNDLMISYEVQMVCILAKTIHVGAEQLHYLTGDVGELVIGLSRPHLMHS